MMPSNKEELLRENEKNFIEGYGSPQGPTKWMKREDIDKIHQ